jgi:hypothetical protein
MKMVEKAYQIEENKQMLREILNWFVKDLDFDYINNVISSPRLKGVKLWWWFGDIKFAKDGQTKSGEMSNVISFIDGVIKTDKGETIDLN